MKTVTVKILLEVEVPDDADLLDIDYVIQNYLEPDGIRGACGEIEDTEGVFGDDGETFLKIIAVQADSFI